MKGLPRIIRSTLEERIAVAKHANYTFQSSVSLIQTSDPDEIDHVIPANDDAIRAAKLTSKMADAILKKNKVKKLLLRATKLER